MVFISRRRILVAAAEEQGEEKYLVRGPEKLRG
jgi:hypothetical protein